MNYSDFLNEVEHTFINNRAIPTSPRLERFQDIFNFVPMPVRNLNKRVDRIGLEI